MQLFHSWLRSVKMYVLFWLIFSLFVSYETMKCSANFAAFQSSSVHDFEPSI